MNKLQTKTATVLVADPVGSLRMMMASVMRSLGFQNVMALESMTEALDVLTKEPASSWLITSLFVADSVNALHLLQKSRHEARLGNLLVSLMVAEPEQRFLAKAFELGLLSAHEKLDSTTQFESAVSEVLAALEKNAWNSTLTAAEYLRRFLQRHKRFAPLVELEKSLCRIFPNEPDLPLHMAEAHLLAGNVKSGQKLLWQILQQSGPLQLRASALAERYLPTKAAQQGVGQASASGACVLIDPDEGALRTSAEYLELCGVAVTRTFTDGAAAWEWLSQNAAPDLLLTEWRVPGVSGPKLLQRLRAAGKFSTNVVITSSLVGRSEQILLSEMSVAAVLEKPAKKSEFVACVTTVLEEARQPTRRDAVVRAFRARLAEADTEGAVELLQSYLAKASPADPLAKRLEGELAFHVGDFVAARDLAKTSIQFGGQDIAALNLLGKALTRLRDFVSALKVFERANAVSPGSIERLCATAEVQCELGDTKAAHATLVAVSTLDSDNQAVINASVNIGLATGDQELVADAFEKFRPTDNVLAFINNRAVALARSGQVKDSIDLYKNALGVLPGGQPHLRALLLYNLALANLRDGNVTAAVETLAMVPPGASPELERKISSLRRRADEAHTAGVPLTLNLQEGASGTSPRSAEFQRLTASLHQGAPPVATFCCYGLFKDTEPPDELVQLLPSLGATRPVTVKRP